MLGDKRNYSLSLWDHKDNFLCLLKPASGQIEGQSYNEILGRNIYGEETLTFTIPAYINEFQENEKWDYIFNEQKIRYIQYDNISSKPIKTKEFVLKHYDENRNGYEKTIDCQCESLAVYELSKAGWGITFDVEYITQYEQENNPKDYLTIDYWLRKLFYKETNLGRVSTTTECTYLLQGLQLRDDRGFPIDSGYDIDSEGNYILKYIDEPICENEVPQKYLNPTGWHWEIQASDPCRLDITENINILYEEPVIDRYIEVTPDNYLGHSYQKEVGQTDEQKRLLPHPIQPNNYSTLRYVTEIKKRLINCERSNIFSILQTLCEEFEVWVYFDYTYNEQGKIIDRKLTFKSTMVNENIVFDFSYGKNLQSCSRSIDSNELVTKLIVPDTESSLDSNRMLSIRQATANPTGENYIYNFEYFYNINTLSKLTEEEKKGNIYLTEHSDEYKINLHCGKLKNLNNKIVNLQTYLVPLYDRQNVLNGDLSVQQAEIIAIKENMRTIQDKIDAIPEEDQIIESWSNLTTQANYIGELKTLSLTTFEGQEGFYVNFGREDVLYKDNIDSIQYTLDENGELVIGSTLTITSYIPKYYTNGTWNKGTITQDSDYTKLNDDNGTPIYSIIGNMGMLGYIKGFFIPASNAPNRNYIRIRYCYAPLAYYYALLKDCWDKLLIKQEQVDITKKNLQEINNKILVNEVALNSLLNQKNELILQFEKEYKNYIKEGYWEPTDYQSQIVSEELNTNNPNNIYEGLITINKKLSSLNLNDSLHNYSYFVKLYIQPSSIDIDSIEMLTINPVPNFNDGVLSRHRGNDYEIYIANDNTIILGIAPSLIDTYKKNNYSENYYKSTIKYKTKESEDIVTLHNLNWTLITEQNEPIIQERYIYLSNDNILTSSLSIYGNNVEQNNLLEVHKDYEYSFDYTGYNSDGERQELDNQDTYKDNIYYDYITKITLKNTNKVNNYNNGSGPFIVKYSKESTLQYLYNDALSTSKKYAVPQITYSISIVDISSLNGYDYYKPILGQKVPIFDREMRLNGYSGIITSIQHTLDKPEETSIEIATYQTRFEDIFQKLTVAMTDVRYNQSEIMNAANAFSISNGTIKAEVFQKSLDNNAFQISMGVNNDIIIDKVNGITLIDKDNNSAVKLIGRGVFLTDNYSENNSQWRTGITGEGINASVLTAGSIDTKNINIWNASEGQIRFVWNEEGLFAYGTDGVPNGDNNVQDFIDYNKYVKFSYNGLQFEDSYLDNGVKKTRSALSLGWDGLSIQAQDNALELNATDGLILKQQNNDKLITRLELGKLDNDSIYGLRLSDPEGNPSFQSDSDGNMWLSRHIKVGGNYNKTTHVYTNAPNAGIVGLTTAEPIYQMGVLRDSEGNPYWESSIIRFWAGPQTKQQYLAQIGISSTEASSIDNWNNIHDNDPALAKFKVDEHGNIIASGIDVGGWRGAGNILSSVDYEAILRSGNYNINGTNYPVIAVGRYNNETNGLNSNLRIFQDGSLNIGRGVFTVDSTGAVSASNLNITGGSIILNGDSDEAAININDVFKVMKDGTVVATNISIGGATSSITGGSIAGWNIEEFKFYKLVDNQYLTALYANRDINASNMPVLYIGEKDHEEDNLGSSSILSENATKSKFKISSDGSVFFHGGIWGWSNSQQKFKRGYTEGSVNKLYTSEGHTIDIEICQGLIIDIN